MKFLITIALAVSIHLCSNQILEPVNSRIYPRKEMLIMISGHIKDRSITTMDSTVVIGGTAEYVQTVGIDSEGDFGVIHYFYSFDTNSSLIFKNNMNLNFVFRTPTKGLMELVLTNVNMYPSSPYEVKNVDSSFLTFDIVMDLFCDESSGRNCEENCGQYNRNEQFCDPIDGKIRYLNLTEHQGDLCPKNDCFNDGTCYVVNSYQQCECPVGSCGNSCEKNICRDQCDSAGGFCDASGSCVCYPGFLGSKCEIATCDRYNPCMNGGKCKIEDNQHVCECNKENFSGKNCELTCPNGCPGGMCIDVGGPACYYDQVVSDTTKSPVTASAKEFTDYLDFTALKTAAIILSVYVIIVIAALLLVKKYFTFFESLKEKMGSGGQGRDTAAMIGTSGGFKS